MICFKSGHIFIIKQQVFAIFKIFIKCHRIFNWCINFEPNKKTLTLSRKCTCENRYILKYNDKGSEIQIYIKFHKHILGFIIGKKTNFESSLNWKTLFLLRIRFDFWTNQSMIDTNQKINVFRSIFYNRPGVLKFPVVTLLNKLTNE